MKPVYPCRYCIQKIFFSRFLPLIFLHVEYVFPFFCFSSFFSETENAAFLQSMMYEKVFLKQLAEPFDVLAHRIGIIDKILHRR